jgi:hypothetical protein
VTEIHGLLLTDLELVAFALIGVGILLGIIGLLATFARWVHRLRRMVRTIDWSPDWNYVGPRPDLEGLVLEEVKDALRVSLEERARLREQVEALLVENARLDRARRRHLATIRRLRGVVCA